MIKGKTDNKKIIIGQKKVPERRSGAFRLKKSTDLSYFIFSAVKCCPAPLTQILDLKLALYKLKLLLLFNMQY